MVKALPDVGQIRLLPFFNLTWAQNYGISLSMFSDQSPTTRWTLTLAQTYEASREVADGKTCRHERSSQVDIGATGAWGTTFGPRMRRLEELPGRPAVLGWTRE